MKAWWAFYLFVRILEVKKKSYGIFKGQSVSQFSLVRKYARGIENEFCVIADYSQTYGYFSKIDKMSCDHLFSLFLGIQKNGVPFLKYKTLQNHLM